MTEKPIPLALCYDFDGTLIPGNMQENSFIPDVGMEKEAFWKQVEEQAEKKDMDGVLSYMYLMLKKAQHSDTQFRRENIRKHGEDLEFFPGVKEWFPAIDKAGRALGLQVEHYVISSGIDEMIKGSAIGQYFKHVFASGFIYDANEVPVFAARSVNYTTKTQYLFRINKNFLNSWDGQVNKYMAPSRRRIPFARMIYIGDGESDVPAMRMINYQGGYSVIVYPPESAVRAGNQNEKEQHSVKKQYAQTLYEQDRAQYIAAADYNKDQRLYKIIVSLLQRIADEESYAMNRTA